jgi:hypothetical protein
VTAAAVWLRVSTGHQDSDNQVPDLERFTAHHGYDVAETYTGYGQDKHETHSGAGLAVRRGPSPVLAPGLAARGTACSLKPLTRSFGRKLQVL